MSHITSISDVAKSQTDPFAGDGRAGNQGILSNNTAAMGSLTAALEETL
jgi:hypothetical protein